MEGETLRIDYLCNHEVYASYIYLNLSIMNRTLKRLLAFSFLLVNLVISGFAQQTSIPLRDGVVIDVAKNTIYFVNARMRLQANSLTTGEILWISNDSVKPLAVINNQLVVQSVNVGNKLVIKQMDVNNKGKQLGTQSIDLPKDTKADFRPSPSSTFRTHAVNINGETYISWEYHETPLRGMLEESMEKNADPIAQSGIVKVDKTSGKLSTVSSSDLPADQLQKSIVPATKDLADNKTGQQFYSSDQNHILVSSRIAGNEDFNNYSWEIYERSSRKKVGERRDYRSYAPFYVSGSTIVFEIGPYSLMEKGNEQHIPLSLVAMNLLNGKELWRAELYDPINRLPPPPGMK